MAKALVIYDTYFGNTEQIAQAVGRGLGAQHEVTVRRVSEAQPAQLEGVGLLVVGSPTRGFRATPAIMGLLGRIPANGLQGVKVAAFDTRISLADTPSAILHFFVRLFGYAAPRIAKQLQAKGGAPAAAPEGFFVQASEGPLKPGELERAEAWGGQIGAGA